MAQEISTLQTEIGQQFKHARKKMNLTMEKASEITGLNLYQLSQIENGKRSMTLKTIFRLAQGYGLTVKLDVVKARKKQPEIK